MKSKGQVLVISLWLLAIATILSVSIGHRVSMALRLARYQRGKLEALYTAKAGINRAISKISNDTTADYDTLKDVWAADEQFFATDEERKINVNAASKELLGALLKDTGLEAAQAFTLADNILIWRGTSPDDDKIYEAIGYKCKAQELANIEEIALVKDMGPEQYNALKDIITVYGAGKININTVSPRVLRIFLSAIAEEVSAQQPSAAALADRILSARERSGIFTKWQDISVAPTGDEELNIFNRLKEGVVFKSDNFLIEAKGALGRIEARISAVYNRAEERIVYYHEG